MVAAVTGQAEQVQVLAAGNYPAASSKASQAQVLVTTRTIANLVQSSQFQVLVAARGSVNDPSVKAWSFTLDGHDYYVLRLGNTETLVFDVASDSWYTWGYDAANLWRTLDGTDWIGCGTLLKTFGTNVVVGDDGNGALYFLDPGSDVDDDPSSGSTTPRPFTRELQTQYMLRGYGGTPCYGIQLQGSVGSYSGTVNLTVSDDRGNTYKDVGTVTTTVGDYSTRINWRSLGSMNSPGRLFKFTDYGALKRIDSLDLQDGQPNA